MEKARKHWCNRLDVQGFPPWMDHLRTMVAKLAQIHAEEEDDPELTHQTIIGWQTFSPTIRVYPRDLVLNLTTNTPMQATSTYIKTTSQN